LSRQAGERLAINVLHGDDRDASGVIHRIDRADIRVVERGGRTSLGQCGTRSHRAIGLEHLQSDWPVELRVPGKVDTSESPDPKLRLDQIVREEATRTERLVGVQMRLIRHAVVAAKTSRLKR
jgi:hypothetical protein